MLGEFLTWWGEQLQSLWPARDSARREDAVFATLRGAAVEIALRRGGRTGALGAFPLTEPGMAALATALGPRRPAAELRLPPAMLLERTVTLPLAAERGLDNVLRYEMDRLTPFAAAELYWHYAVAKRDRVHAQLHIRLWLVLRAPLAGTLDLLARAGLHPAAIASVDAGGPAIPLELTRPGRWHRQGTAALAAACALLAVTACVVPFVKQSLAAHAVDARIAALKPAVDRAESLRRSLLAASAGIDVLAAERAKVGDPLETLAALTDVLPDDTVLTDLSLHGRAITISGQSGAAASLISRIAADPALRDPAFTAPVTRNETTHTDGFSIRAAAGGR